MTCEWKKKSLEELTSAIGDPGSRASHAVQIEMLRRQTAAQVWSAWLQFAAVIAMFLAVMATVATPWITRHVLN